MSEQTPQRPERLRIAASMVMDEAALAKARAKAEEHGMDFARFLEGACRLYGRYLDKKVTIIARPL